MKKIISMALAFCMTVMLMVGLSGCGNETKPSTDDSSTSNKSNSSDEKVKLVSDTVNGITLNIPDDFSEFTSTKGMMLARNDASTATIVISEAKDASGTTPDAFNVENYQTTQMTTYTNVEFIEFNNKATIDGVPAVYAHATGINPNGVKLELYSYILFFEDGRFQSIAIVFSEGSNTSIQGNIQAVINSIKLSK